MNHRILLAFTLLISSATTVAETFGYDSHLSQIKAASEGYETTYLEVLQQYDEHLSKHPQDVLALTEKCQFINSYTYAESDLLYFESLYDDFEGCEAQVQQQPEDHPDRVLYDIRHLWGEEATAKYLELKPVAITDWSPQQQLRFFQWIENTQKWSDEYDASIPYSGYQVTQDAQFVLGAAIYEAQSGNPNQALALLEDLPVIAIEDRVRLAQLYVDLQLPERANQALNELTDDSGVVDEVAIIKLKTALDKDHIPTTSQLTAIKEYWQGADQLKVLFEHAINNNLQALAKKVYQSWNSDDFWQDPFKYHKYRLYQTTDSWEWEWRDLYAGLMWLAVVLVCFLLAFLVIAPVHYRGLYRRVHGKKPLQSMTNWNLKHGLFLLTMFFVVGTLLALILQYDGFYSSFFGDEELPFSTENGINAKLYLIDALIMVIMSLLIFKHGRSLFKITAADLFKTLFATVGIFILFKLVYIAMLSAFKLTSLATAFDLVQLTITDINNNYGLLVTYLTIALITPLIEEYLFRGVLLNSFSKHITFGWANTIQAALFAIIHDNPDHYLHHFLFGLIVGYLVKTQKHLYGAIIFHMINNALAITVLLL